MGRFQNHALIKILSTLVSLVLTPIIVGEESIGSSSSLVIAPHCTSICGNLSIPYPFGIEDGCYFVDDPVALYPIMQLTCNDTHYDPPQLIFLGLNLEILDISILDSEIRVNNEISYNCYEGGVSTARYQKWLDLVTMTLSSTKNKLIATGCDTYAWFYGTRHDEPYSIGCMTECDNLRNIVDGQCNGVGCCEASIPDAITNIKIKVASFDNHTGVDFNPCSVAYPVAKDAFVFKRSNLTQTTGFYSDYPKLPVVFNWGIGTKKCSLAKADGSCLCKNNTICTDLTPHQYGYLCGCEPGFTGNPYLPQGCTDINECDKVNECEKPEYCVNTLGSYFCQCPEGYHGNGTQTHKCVSSRKSWLTPVIITAGIGGGIIVLLVVGFLLHLRHGRIKVKELRENFYQQNGGLVLTQKHSTQMKTLKIFTSQDLEDATQKYNEINIIGKGGFGVVYKGLLPNNQVIAIKRSIKVDPGQVEQFINEVLVLSQINNRNIVKLIGCCLETEVPLLVYEFINNGTLYDHLSDDSKASRVTWQMRLRIASEIAEVLAYLHTTISTPIIHRDMKSANILLDEYYTAKVADFGASRLCPIDRDQLATMVLGTIGYLDPEYMQTSELTEKSDVYSFGVVLVELLTRQKAICYERPEVERCLAMHFLLRMKENRLFEIIDRIIVNNELEIEQIKEVAILGACCLRLRGDERPTMKEVARELDRIQKTGRHPWDVVRPTFDQRDEIEYLVGIREDDDGNIIGGKDSDLYNPHGFFSPLGGGR